MGLLESVERIAREFKALEVARPDAITWPDDISEWTGYKMLPLQEFIAEQERRFNVEILHRRFGKTVKKIDKLVRRAIHNPLPDPRYAYIAPTYGQAEDIAWMYLQQMTEKMPGVKVEKSKLAVYIPTKAGSAARIRLYGADTQQQRLRGLYLDGCVFDEFPFIPWSVFTEQVRPMLSDKQRAVDDLLGLRNQWCDFIGTPRGRNHAYTAFKRAEAWMNGQSVEVDGVEVTDNEWTAILMSADITGHIDPEELRKYKMLGRNKYRQEFMCDWDAALEGAIFGAEMEWLRKKGRMKRYPYNPHLPVHTGWDLGYSPDPTCIWFAQVYNPWDIRIIHYYEKSGAPLHHFAKYLADMSAKHGYKYGKHFLPADVNVTEMGSGKTRRAILRSYGVRVTTVPKHAREDGITAAQAILPYCRFDEAGTVRGVDCLSLYQREYNDKLGTFSDAPRHDWASHGADAFRYLIVGLRRPRSEENGRSNYGASIGHGLLYAA